MKGPVIISVNYKLFQDNNLPFKKTKFPLFLCTRKLTLYRDVTFSTLSQHQADEEDESSLKFRLIYFAILTLDYRRRTSEATLVYFSM